MSADGKHSLLNTEKLTHPIQMELSRKQKSFSRFFFCIFEIWFKFWTFLKKKMNHITDVFSKLRTQKNLVRSMPKKSCFNGSFAKEHGNRAQTLLKFQWQHIYDIYWLLWRILSYKKSLLVICKISRLFLNTMSADGKFSLVNRDNLTQSI